MMNPFNFRSSLPAAALAALLPCLAVQAQEPAQKPAPAAAPATAAAPAVRPITLPVTVVDKKGDPVKGLTPAELTLTDNGQLQDIQSFAVAQPQPIVFGLIGQISMGLRTELGDERLATTHFVDHTLPGTDDKAFVIQYAGEVDLLEDPTAVQNKLHDAIDHLGSPQFGNQNGGGDSGGSGDQTSHAGHGVGGTLNDAIYLASMEVMKKQPGRHVLVLVSDGVDSDSKESLNDAIQAAQDANTTIFAIYFKPEEENTNTNQNQNQNRRGGMGGPGFPGGGGGYPGGGGGYPGGGGGGRRGGGPTQPSQPRVNGMDILEHICSATGGYMVEGKKDKADEAFAKISALLKNQYAVTWVPNAAAAQFSSHHITLTPKKNDVWTIVQADFSTHQ